MNDSLIGSEDFALLLEALPRGGRLLEIGTYLGATARRIAEARPDVKILCLDSYPKEPPEGARIAGDPSAWLPNRCPGMCLFVGGSEDLFDYCKGSLFDVVFVDGDHREYPTLADLAVAMNLVKPEGSIICHDYGRPGSFADVARAIERFAGMSEWRVHRTVHYSALLRRGSP